SERVPPQEDKERGREDERVPVKVLDEERKARFARVALARIRNGARRRRPKERAVVGAAVVVAGHAECERECHDQDRGREIPVRTNQRQRRMHAVRAEAGRVERREIRVVVVVRPDELGAPLFHRMTGNVALTPAGETLLPWARRVLADIDGATGEVRELADLRRGRLAVGATPSLTITLLPPALAKFHVAFPGIELVLHEAGSRDLVAELEQGALDVALVIMPVRHENLETAPLLREELVIAVPHDHPLASRKTVPIADLKG